jgi:uncharacterized protein
VDLATKFSFYLSTAQFGGISEIELSEDDLDVDFVEGNFLGVDQVVREQVVLNVPMKSLCTQECKGLCPLCGCNLNAEKCSCAQGRESLFV